MKSKSLIGSLFSFVSLFVILSGLKAHEGKVEHISLKEGLSHIGVTCFCSDSKGFLWIGTFDGLNRYDGRNFVVYNHQPGNRSSLYSNRVSAILEYNDDFMLIGTEGGLCVFDKRKEVFSHFGQVASSELETGFVNKLYRDKEGYVWVLINNNTLFQLTDNWKVKKQIVLNDFQIRGRVIDFNIFSSDDILLLTNLNVYRFTHDDLQLIELDRTVTGNAYRRLIEGKGNQYYLLSNKGLSSLRYAESGQEASFQLIGQALQGHDCISGFLDSNGNIWIGSKDDGVRCYSKDLRQEQEHFSTKTEQAISSNWISCIFEDQVGGIWFGTTEKGINKFNPDRSYFKAYQSKPSDKYGFENTYITGLTQLRNGLILIGSRKDGVSVYDMKRKLFVKPFFQAQPLEDKTVNAIYEDSNGIVWLSSEGNIYRWLPGSLKLELVNVRQFFNRPDINVMSFCEDDSGQLWIGTRQGLFQLILDKNYIVQQVIKLEDSIGVPFGGRIVNTIFNDPLNADMWVGTWSDGLFQISTNTADSTYTFKQYIFDNQDTSTLRSNFISSIHRSTNLQLWVGTEGGGFSRLINPDEGFEHFGVDDGLSNNVVKNISEDMQGRLWISTNNGLNLFNPATKKFKTFTESNGLSSNYFNKTRVKLKTGEILLGGNNGITAFNPDLIGENNYLAVPEFGQFQLSYETINPGKELGGKVVLDKALSYTSVIELNHDQNVFSIEMLGIHFDDASDLRYRYRLVGYDRDWLTVNSTNNFASYTNVPSGKYTFEFMVANGFEQWSPATKSIQIIIHPPFWLSPLAYVIYVLLIILILVIVFWVLIKIERLNHKVKFEQFEKEKEKEMHDVKLRFFTNISHEIRTPVSLILGPIDSLLNQFKAADGVRHNLLLVKKQANYLLRLLEQLLEFRKAESEALELKCHKADIVDHVKWIFKGFEKQAGNKNITFRFVAKEPIVLWFDASKVDKIAYNLISNALKYTPNSGKVTVGFECDSNGMVVMSVSDNGIGLNEEERKNVFNRFYRANTDSELTGTGIGLALAQSLARLHGGYISVESEKGQGSTFSFHMPLDSSYLEKEQMEEGGTFVQTKSDLYSGEGQDELASKPFEMVVEGKTILVVEDNIEMRQFLVDTLGMLYVVKSCSNGLSAFDVACNMVPDLIISDVMMPGMNGIELLQKLKQEIVTSHIPVILLTAKNEITDRLEGLEFGADDYLSKPFQIDILKARIKSLIVNRELLHKRYASGLKGFTDVEQIPELKREAEFVNSLNQLIETHLQDSDFGSDEISKALFISRTGFYKKMKDLMGTTPGEYLKDYRIKRAGELLKTGEYSVSEVIGMVGVKSRSHFYKCFKEQFGQLPTDYIQRDE